MQDEEMAVNQVNGEEAVVNATPAVEEQATGEVQAEAQASAEVQTETDGTPKKGINSRIRELVGERNQYRDEAQSLKQRLDALGQTLDQTPQPVPQFELGSEVSPEQYQEHITRQAEAIVNIKLKQFEAVNNVRQESEEVVRMFPELDPDSDRFDQELSDTIFEAVEAQVKTNPYGTSVKKFVEKLMKPYQRAISTGVAKEKETIAKQVSETALRPTQLRKQEKSFGEMSIQEMEARLGILQA